MCTQLHFKYAKEHYMGKDEDNWLIYMKLTETLCLMILDWLAKFVITLWPNKLMKLKLISFIKLTLLNKYLCL